MKILRIIAVVFALIGIAALIGAGALYFNSRAFIDTAETATGTVTELVRSRSSDSTTYAPVVSFVATDGEQYSFTHNISRNPPAYSQGEQVPVLYPPDNPNRARIESAFSLWGGALIVGALGAVFALIGGGLALVPFLSRRKAKQLLAGGRRIEAAFQGVERNTSVHVNGRHPYCIISQWQNPVTSEVHVFRSGNLWFDPTEYIDRQSIPVYLDPDNPRRYHVDLSFLPKQA